MLFADLLSLHLVTFLMFFILVVLMIIDTLSVQQFASGCHSSKRISPLCSQFVHSVAGLLSVVDSALTVEQIDGSVYSLDWTTGLDYWTGPLDSPEMV